MGLRIAGLDVEVAWWADHDKDAEIVMSAHHPGAPNLGDVTLIEDPPPADIVCAGFPCQPTSQAGKGAGTEDERWIIDDICGTARASGADWIFLENVLGILSGQDGNALSAVCAALAESGFVRWEWSTLRAADVGGCHRRERWFLVGATADPDPLRWDEGSGPSESGPPRLWRDGPHNSRRATAPGIERLPTPMSQRSGTNRSIWKDSPARPSLDMIGDLLPEDSDDHETIEGRFGKYAESIEIWSAVLGRPAPPPKKGRRLSSAFVEWMMGLPEGHVVGQGLSRSQELERLGNGAVPLQAGVAFVGLVDRLLQH